MHKKNFTLIEVLAVISIIAVLTGLVAAGYSAVRSQNHRSKTIAMMKKMEIALDLYRNDWGYYPQQATAGVLNWDRSGFRNPEGRYYLEDYSAGNFKDGYGQLFFYQSPGTMNPEKYDMWSMGQDQKHGKAGTDIGDAQSSAATNSDDISNWKRN